MKILWLSHLVPYPLTGGVMQRSYNLLREAASVHEVTFAGLSQKSMQPDREALAEAVREFSTFCKEVVALPIPADRSRLHWTLMAGSTFFRRSPYDVNWLRSAALLRELRGLARRKRFDLIHVDTAGMLPYLRAFPGVPFVLNHHNVESDMMHRRAERESSLPMRIYLRREAAKLESLERAACPRAAANLVVSDLDGERLRQIVGDVPVHVVANGVDTTFFSPAAVTGGEDGGLVFAGGMNWYPNRKAVLFFLREIWPLLPEATRRATIVGQSPPAELLAAAERDPRLVVPGLVPDVRPYLHDASIYICPIQEGGGTRLKILDALAAGKPLVATAMAVEGLNMEEDVHYLRAEHPQQFVDQILRLQSQPELRQTLADAGRRFVETRYSWPVIGRELDHAYERAASFRRLPSEVMRGSSVSSSPTPHGNQLEHAL